MIALAVALVSLLLSAAAFVAAVGGSEIARCHAETDLDRSVPYELAESFEAWSDRELRQFAEPEKARLRAVARADAEETQR